MILSLMIDVFDSVSTNNSLFDYGISLQSSLLIVIKLGKMVNNSELLFISLHTPVRYIGKL